MPKNKIIMPHQTAVFSCRSQFASPALRHDFVVASLDLHYCAMDASCSLIERGKHAEEIMFAAEGHRFTTKEDKSYGGLEPPRNGVRIPVLRLGYRHRFKAAFGGSGR
jgi:hypothetical protein